MQLSEITGIKRCTRTYRPSEEVYDPYCVVGVEIEVEYGNNRAYAPDRSLWKTASDGSLREGGLEYVTEPMFGEDLVTALVQIEQGLISHKANISFRCGLHVHVDVSGFSIDQLLSFITLVGMVEPALFEYVGKERANNIHCLPFSDTGNVLPWLNGIKYGQTTKEILQSVKKLCKYSGFNVLPILTQGSVEFRHHRGTYSKEAILNWINILLKLRTESMRYTAVDIAAMSREEINSIFMSGKALLSPEQYRVGRLTAKDILNFNHLEDGWNSIKDRYYNKARLPQLVKN